MTVGTLFNPEALVNCFHCIFHSFEAGIANAISSSDYKKNIFIWKKENFSGILFGLKLASRDFVIC